MAPYVPLMVPIEGPLTLAALRIYLRIDTNADDLVLQSVLPAARALVEQRCGQLLCIQKWRLRLDAWPEAYRVAIPFVPFRSVIAARIFNAAGIPTPIPAANYVSTGIDPAFVQFSNVTAPGQRTGGIEIDIEAGYGAASDVPAALAVAVLRFAARLYETRGDETAALRDDVVDALIAPFRAARLT